MISKYKKGDILVEDRSKWIGTPEEYHCDKEFPIVRLEVLGVYPEVDKYFLHNITRNRGTLGNISGIDSLDDFKLESRGRDRLTEIIMSNYCVDCDFTVDFDWDEIFGQLNHGVTDDN